MPGTPEEYEANPKTGQAAEIIDMAISEGKAGTQILDDLEAQGLRVYAAGEMAGEEAGLEEATAGLEEIGAEDILGGGPLEGSPEEMETPFPPASESGGGDDGGMRGMRIDAVRFAVDKDKKNKKKNKEDNDRDSEAAYA